MTRLGSTRLDFETRNEKYVIQFHAGFFYLPITTWLLEPGVGCIGGAGVDVVAIVKVHTTYWLPLRDVSK